MRRCVPNIKHWDIGAEKSMVFRRAFVVVLSENVENHKERRV